MMTAEQSGDKDVTLDATGLLCPLPVLKARKALKSMDRGAVLTVLATDPGAVEDFKSFCEAQGHQLLECSESDAVLRFQIARGDR